jgi:hypothetical protein
MAIPTVGLIANATVCQVARLPFAKPLGYRLPSL